MPPEGLAGLVLAALDVSPDGFGVFRAEGPLGAQTTSFRIEAANRSLPDLLRREPRDWSGHDLVELIPDAQDRGLAPLMAATLADGEPRRLRLELHGAADPDDPSERPADADGTDADDPSERARGADGTDADGLAPRVVECMIVRLTAEPIDRVVVAVRDISELAAGERLLAAAYEMTADVRATLQTALDATSDAFAVYDVVRDADAAICGLQLVLINVAGALPLSGGDPDELVGQDLRDFYPESVETGLWDAICTALERQVTTTFRLMEIHPPGGTDPTGGRVVPPTPSSVHAWDNTIAPVGEERVVITWRDVSEEVRRERELEQAHDDATYAATHDPLTGLANRALLLEELTEALWASGEDERVGVAFVDLDGFKGVNDHYGHAVGDELLQRVAARLLRIVRQGDTVARVGGDEFVLVLRRLPRDWDTQGFLDRAQAAMEEPLMLAAGTVAPQASYGLVVSPPAPRDLDRLLRLADHEMYQRKQERKERAVAANAMLPA
jgi:diguanylate cyclase (GGDEF)-like protein